MEQRKLEILYISTECYPAAKVGGLADVVGSLPKYLNRKNANVGVAIPKYRLEWIMTQEYEFRHSGSFYLGSEEVWFTVEKVKGNPLGFDLYTIDIPGKFDRNGVYSNAEGEYFWDEVGRYISFSRSFLDWVSAWEKKPDLIHCHDHHTGLVPFMMQHCFKYKSLSRIPVVFTIHNERYQGVFRWDLHYLLPAFDSWKSGMIDWRNAINPLAAGVKCSWKVTTVSPSYMEELKHNSFGLEGLFHSEAHKCRGILNGIDAESWDPKTDPLISHHLKRSIPKFKEENKNELLSGGVLKNDVALVSFIGRFAGEKGADLLPGVIDRCLSSGMQVQFLVLGTGDKSVEHYMRILENKYPYQTFIRIAYNEKFAHQVYAGSDFLIMPSRVEPCGLNQMYAMRYGTIPIVHNIGGLKDSVVDIEASENGSGIKMHTLHQNDLIMSVYRAVKLYDDKKRFQSVQKFIMGLDFSWDQSAQEYMNLYQSLTNN